MKVECDCWSQVIPWNSQGSSSRRQYLGSIVSIPSTSCQLEHCFCDASVISCPYFDHFLLHVTSFSLSFDFSAASPSYKVIRIEPVTFCQSLKTCAESQSFLGHILNRRGDSSELFGTTMGWDCTEWTLFLKTYSSGKHIFLVNAFSREKC